MAVDWLYSDGSDGTVSGDLVIQGGSPVLISGTEELAQAIRSLLTTPKGTFEDDEERGMDMSFLVGGFDADMAQDAAREAIMQDKRVIAIHDITVTPDYDTGVAVFNIALTSTVGDIGMDRDWGTEVKLSATNG